MADAYIVEAVRTPVGRRGGGLAGAHPADLGAHALKALVDRAGIDPETVDDVIFGCVGQIGAQSLDIARTAWLSAGLPESVPGVTVDRQCGSSQQAAQFASATVMAGIQDLVVAGGVEVMSLVPISRNASPELGAGEPFNGERWLERYGDQQISQFRGAELIAEQWDISREDMEELALESHTRASQAWEQGRFDREVAAYDGVSRDEGPRPDTSLEKMATLNTLTEGGRMTAAVASQISDGAAAMLIASEDAVRRYGLTPRARFHTQVVAGSDPVLMLTGPIPATEKALARAGLSIDDIDLFEINEAFAPVVLAWHKETGAPLEKTNVNGGAIALGHPLGATGARLMTTLLHELERSGGRYGLQTMCEGGGQANATILERVQGMATTAIVGLGITEMGKVYGRTALDFAGEAISLALVDAGLQKSDVDGLLVNRSMAEETGQPMVQMELGFEDMRLVNVMNVAGGTAGAMLQYATAAIDSGLANVVALVYADAPLRESASISDSGYSGKGAALTGLGGLRYAYGDYGPANTGYAQAARRHMHLYGTTSEQLGTIAVGQRAWALQNPKAQMKKPMTLEDHQSSRLIVDPLHLFDCCLVSNGAIAVIVTAADRAGTLKQPPVYLRGFGQGHPGDNQRSGRDPAVHTGAAISGPIALRQAGISLEDVAVLSLYDCYTYTVLVTLEDYGFCGKGEGGPFVEDGKLGPGGSLPTNTGGGQLSSFYMWGFTPLSEGVIQARGEGGPRQSPRHDHVLVSGNGGVLNWHSTTILSTHAA